MPGAGKTKEQSGDSVFREPTEEWEKRTTEKEPFPAGAQLAVGWFGEKLVEQEIAHTYLFSSINAQSFAKLLI